MICLSTIFDAISACECNEEGSVLDEHQHATCFDNGRCTCKGPNIAGDKCDQCKVDHWNFPACKGI